MKYTDELAREIASRHNVTAGQIKIWKHRGRIPDRYNSDTPRPEPADLDDLKVKRLLEVCAHPAIAPSKFRTMPAHWWTQHRSGDFRLTVEHVTNIRRELVELRNLLRRVRDMRSPQQMFQAVKAEKRLHPFNLVGSHRLYDRLRGRLHCDETTLEEIRACMARTYSEINPA